MTATLLRLACASLWNRRLAAGLTVLAIALSVAALLGTEKLRRDAREAFAGTLSGTDLLVGARTGQVQLLLYAVFRIGDATSNVSWQSYRDVAGWPEVAWTVPLSLGDSYRGYRVLGTTAAYFEHYRHGRDRRLRFAAGGPFADVYDAVLGAEVARRLRHAVGDELVIAHGTGRIGLVEHEDKPFRVAGVLAPTGTPVDRTVHVGLDGIEAMHLDWRAGIPVKSLRVSAEDAREMDLTPRSITAFLLGVDSKLALFQLQRRINRYAEEPLLAVIPGVALQELWNLVGVAEQALLAVSSLVVVTGLLGMLTLILVTLEGRRRELAVLRAVGARASHLFGLLVLEAGALAAAGAVAAVALLAGSTAVVRPLVAREFGVELPLFSPAPADLALLAAVLSAGLLAGCLPAWRAYRLSLADGLSPRT